jgi:RNA polymerase sigma-70 factor (ECF subfamily)
MMAASSMVPLEASFEALVALETPRLHALARRLLWDDEEAKELVQASLAHAWVQRHTLRDPSLGAAWLKRIVVHRALSALRRRRLWSALAGMLGLDEREAPPPDAALEHKQHRLGLSRALSAVPARQATAFTLRYLEGLSLDEVADAMGCGRGTVRIHVQRAVRALKEQGVLT